MIDKILNIERLEYKSNQTSQDFKKRLEKIFNQRTLKFNYNISGKFINDHEFKVRDKWTIGIVIRSFERDPAYLKGIINETRNRLSIDISVRPNSIFPIFGLLFPIFGISALFATGFGSTNEEGLIVGLVFIVIGLLSYQLGRFLRNRLKDKFEQYLDLKRKE